MKFNNAAFLKFKSVFFNFFTSKTIICLLLTVCMVVSLASCVKGGNEDDEIESSIEHVDSTSEERTVEESTSAESVADESSAEESTSEDIIADESSEEESMSVDSTETDTESSSDTEDDSTEDTSGKIMTSHFSSYSVVRSASASAAVKKYATDLADALSETWNLSVKARTDTVMEGMPQFAISDYEILVGDTNRQESIEFISSLGKYDYGYSVINNKIVIAGRSEGTIRFAIDMFIRDVISVKDINNEVYLTNDECKVNVINISDDIPETSDNMLKIMSFNVQVWEQSESRYNGVIKQIKEHMPDSFGVQEADGTWMRVLAERLASSNYAYVGIGRENNTSSEHSAIFYRMDKFELVDSGTKWLTATPDTPSKIESAGYRRIVTWATLRRISDGKIFIHANTHLDHQSEDARYGQVTHLLDIINTLPDYPIVLTGDFNAVSSESAFKLITNAGYVNSAAYNLGGDDELHRTYHGYTESGGSAIDFGFVRPDDFTVLYYKVVDSATPADHYAVYFEFAFHE